MTSAYQPPKIKNEPVDVDAIKPDLNTDFNKNFPYHEGIIIELYDRAGKEYLWNPLNSTHRLTARM